MKELAVQNTTFKWGTQTYIMGIINATPDSFSGDGLIQGDDWIAGAVAQGLQFVADGAHILDVGGESTRPGSAAIDAAEEQRRVVPVIEALSQAADVPISIDTYKAPVAEAALDAGAAMVNDVWGLRMDPEIAPLCARRNAPLIVMHNRSRPRDVIQQARLGNMYAGSNYNDLLADVTRELQESIDWAKAAGIPQAQIIIDPGIGFGKSVQHNLTLINRLDHFRRLGQPILLGSSNKSFIGYTLDLPADDRIEGTAATITIGIARGADIVRVHQVKQMARIAKMTDAIVRLTAS
jgi:dihydropteroate synthase